MRSSRRGLVHRLTAILMVVAMPLCCCVLNANAGSSCCAPAEVVETPSCCSSQHCQAEQPEQEPESSPCTGDGCQCCLKAPVAGFDWTPPVDTIGTMSPDTLVWADPFAGLRIMGSFGGNWDEPPPKPGDPGCLRGLVILQV